MFELATGMIGGQSRASPSLVADNVLRGVAAAAHRSLCTLSNAFVYDSGQAEYRARWMGQARMQMKAHAVFILIDAIQVH